MKLTVASTIYWSTGITIQFIEVQKNVIRFFRIIMFKVSFSVAFTIIIGIESFSY